MKYGIEVNLVNPVTFRDFKMAAKLAPGKSEAKAATRIFQAGMKALELDGIAAKYAKRTDEDRLAEEAALADLEAEAKAEAKARVDAELAQKAERQAAADAMKKADAEKAIAARAARAAALKATAEEDAKKQAEDAEF